MKGNEITPGEVQALASLIIRETEDDKWRRDKEERLPLPPQMSELMF